MAAARRQVEGAIRFALILLVSLFRRRPPSNRRAAAVELCRRGEGKGSGEERSGSHGDRFRCVEHPVTLTLVSRGLLVRSTDLRPQLTLKTTREFAALPLGFVLRAISPRLDGNQVLFGGGVSFLLLDLGNLRIFGDFYVTAANSRLMIYPWSLVMAVTFKSREDHRKQLELEEARKAGLAPAEVDEDGNEINPHIPQYMSSAPWYLNAEKPVSGWLL